MSEPDPLAGAAQEWFKKGTDAMQRQNWDFSVECFSNAIKMKPDIPLYRQTKLGCTRKKYDDNGTGAKMATMKLMGTKGKIKKARMKKDWKSVDQLAEEGLAVNPWDAALLADIGQAAAERELTDIAKWGYTEAVKLDLKNIDHNRALGNILYERGEYKEAHSCFKRIYEVDPMDGDARSMMGKIDADSVVDRGGYGKAESTQDVKTENKEVDAYEADRRARKGAQKESVAPGESEEMDTRAAIRKDPENVALYLKLSDILRTERRLPEAIEQLDKALEIAPNDVGLLELKEDIELDIMRDRLGEASDRARKNPKRERLAEKAKALSEELATREMEVLASRIENHPHDMKMRLELAEHYRSKKKFKEAIPLLQQATKDSRLESTALVALGECFVRTGQMSLGKRQFEKALEGINGKDNEDAFKNAHYYLGRIFEKAKKNEQAEHHYGEILGVDYEYRDAQKRLVELQGGDEFEDFDDM